MIPYKSPLATAVPQSVEVRLEILKAAQTLTENGEDRLRERRRAIASIRHDLEEITQDFLKLSRGLRPQIREALRKYGYNPNEPRIPKYNPGGGEWTRVAASDDSNEASDAAEPGFPFQKYGRGHHWVPKTVWKDRKFPEKTKKFFDNAKSGPLADPTVNINDTEHIEYNKAVNKLLDEFMNKNDIAEDQMTPAQAEQFVEEVKGSAVPQIRQFVLKIQREALRYFRYYGPGGRGGGRGDPED
jgi:hypothetical protein